MTDDRLKPGNCHKCGLPMSDNPHPEAGKPAHYLSVGCPRECIPCLVHSRHQWASRAMRAESEVLDLQAARATAEQSTFALQALVAAGHVSQAKVDEALSIAGKTPGIRAAEQNQSDAWKEYAQHLEHCRQCGEMSYTDCDEGTRLHDDANSIESQQDAAIESKPAEQPDPIRELIAVHAEQLDQNDYAYFELAYTRHTAWMAWLCSNSRDDDPNRKVLAKGQGHTPEEACAAAIESQRSGDGS